MTLSRVPRLKAQNSIRKAVAEYTEGEVVLAGQEYDSGNVHTLSQREITDGVIAFLLQCNIVAGSAGDIDLYSLIATYLRNPEVRRQLNQVVADRGAAGSSGNQVGSRRPT